MTQKIAVTLAKGGPGKTSVVFNLAAQLGSRGYKVLVLDLDPQRSLSLWCKSHKELLDLPTVYDLFVNNLEITDIIVGTPQENVYLCPSDRRLSGLEKDLQIKIGTQNILAEKLAGLEGVFDFVLIDTSNKVDLALINSFIYVEELIIPVVDTSSLEGLKETFEIYEEVKTHFPNLKIKGILLNKCSERTKLARFLRNHLTERYGDIVFTTSIPETIRMREAPGLHKSIFQHAPGTLASIKYLYLTNELFGTEEKKE